MWYCCDAYKKLTKWSFFYIVIHVFMLEVQPDLIRCCTLCTYCMLLYNFVRQLLHGSVRWLPKEVQFVQEVKITRINCSFVLQYSSAVYSIF